MSGRIFSNPANALYPMRYPEAALPMADGGYAILDDNGRRITRVDAQGIVLWFAGNDASFGTFMAMDSSQDGTLYVIDRLEGSPRTERVVRIDAQGTSAGIISQKSFSGSGSFVSGSLRIAGNEAWYLFTGDDGFTSMARADLASSREKIVIKTEWRINRAALAVSGSDVYLAVGGGLLRWSSGRFQALTEYSSQLPRPGDIRAASDGTIYISDASRGLLSAIGKDGKLATVLSAEALGKASARPTGVVFDSFAINPSGFTLVDQASNSIMDVEPSGRVQKLLRALYWPQKQVQAERRAWLFAAASALVALCFIIYVLAFASTKAPRALSVAIRWLPVLLLVFAGMASLSYLNRSKAYRADCAAELARLQTAATKSAPTLDAALIAQVDSPDDMGSVAWLALKKSLSVIAGGYTREGRVPFAIVYRERDGALRFIADARGDFVPSMPQRFAFPEYRRVFREGSPDTGILVDDQGSWLAAVYPIAGPDGATQAMLELSIAMPVAPALSVSWPDLLVSVLVYAGVCGTAILLASRRRAVPEALDMLMQEQSAEAGAESGAQAEAQAETEAKPEQKVSQGRAVGAQLSADEANHRAIEALKSGQAELAITLLQSVLDIRPGDSGVLNNLAIAYKRSGNYAAAVDCLQRCVKLDPHNLQAQRNLERMKAMVQG